MTTSRDLVPVPARWLRRRIPADVPVTPRSIALFRLGEQCNNKCPMCSNSGRPEAFFQPIADLLARADFLRGQGFRRVVVTGGEPTIHPGFWQVIARLGENGIVWDANTNGRSFADPAFTARAVDAGLQRAIVSLHSHRSEASQEISGVSAKGHEEIVCGITELLRAGADIMLNCVITRLNIGELADYLRWCLATWGGGVQVKFAFPTSLGKGGEWAGIHLRYEEVQAELRALQELADSHGGELLFESVPPCILGDAGLANMGRSGFGETHYLEDITGNRLYAMRHIEAALSVHAEACRTCSALPHCPGIGEDYARRFGTDALRPFP